RDKDPIFINTVVPDKSEAGVRYAPPICCAPEFPGVSATPHKMGYRVIFIRQTNKNQISGSRSSIAIDSYVDIDNVMLLIIVHMVHISLTNVVYFLLSLEDAKGIFKPELSVIGKQIRPFNPPKGIGQDSVGINQFCQRAFILKTLYTGLQI